MQTGKNIPNLIAEIMDQESRKRDLIVPSSVLTMDREGDAYVVRAGGDTFTPTSLFHRQAAAHLDIPGGYYERLREQQPGLLLENVNVLLHAREGERRMVRALGSSARAFLSDRYRRLDYSTMAARVLPEIAESGAVVRSANLTDSRLYLHVAFPSLEGEVRPGHPIQLGYILTNSEVGLGSLSVQQWLMVLACSNGMIRETVSRKAHLGARTEFDALSFDALSDEAQAASDEALWLAMRDTVRSLSTPARLSVVLDQLRAEADIPLTAKPDRAVQVLAKANQLREAETQQILMNLLQSGDFTRWGVSNAVTLLAHDSESYDRAVELERLGGAIMQDDSGWKTLNAKAEAA
jgi:hypothetical protein